MKNTLLKNRLKRLKLLFKRNFDQNEIKFILKKRNIDFDNNETILVEVQENYFYLLLIEKLITQKKIKNVIGVYTNKFYYNLFEIILIIPFVLRFIIYRKKRKKFKALYLSIGLKEIYNYGDLSIKIKVKNFFKSFEIFFVDKKNLVNFKNGEILFGDLILDTYYRYYNKPFLSKSFKLFFIYLRGLNSLALSKKLNENFEFNKIFFEFSCYVHHGIFVRYFMKKGIDVFVSGTEQKLFKKMEINHPYDSINFKTFYQKENKRFTNIQLNKAKTKLENRFEGKPDMKYMTKSSYGSNNSFSKINFDGVVFLHDFFDCVHLYGDLIFDDFYEWTIFLIELTLKNNLNIGFKPHPLQRPESKKISDRLKLKYNKINWIDENINNKAIFNSSAMFGVSVYGTVLSELAYHGKIAISCGENPSSPFNFTFEAKSREELKSMILNYRKLKMPTNFKSNIFAYYVSNYLIQKSDLDLMIDEKLSEIRFYEYGSEILNL